MLQPESAGGKPAADRRLDVRYVGPVNGRYTLGKQQEGVAPEIFACRTQSISATAAAVTAPVSAAAGTEVTARLEGLGLLRGKIIRLVPDGFVFGIELPEKERGKLAASIEWLKKNRILHRDDKRQQKRFPPRDPRSVMTMGDAQVPCFVINLSGSGAAVSAPTRPKLGAAITLGSVAARVVRYLEVGFAVQFDTMQDAATIEGRLRRQQAGATTAAPTA